MFNGQPLNEQQKEELNGHVENLPIILELRENDATIMEKLGGLEVGQAEIEERLDEGADQFKKLWSEVKDVKKDVSELKDTITNGIEVLRQEIFNSKLDAAINKNTELAQENQDLKNKLNKEDDKSWDIKKSIITGVVGLICLGVGVALGWK